MIIKIKNKQTPLSKLGVEEKFIQFDQKHLQILYC